MASRRSIRHFSDAPVPLEIIKNILQVATSAPSGANKQPWKFVVVKDGKLKHEIRLAAEAEEREFYTHRATREWLEALNPFETDWHKPFLETAPYLIVVFKQVYELDENEKHKNYYVNESVGIACGFLLSALHYAGLVALTHTPSPMGFLESILQRPPNEKAYLLIPVGLPAPEAKVPDLQRKPFDEMVEIF
jgi:nitroreductase